MAIEQINVNNELFTPDENGVCDLLTLLRQHQSLDTCMPVDKIRFVTAEQWQTLSATAEDDIYYFVGR